ncbi:hypothetical protein KLA_07742 [Cellulophaga geojensis KL-A]|uniref:Short-chain dehydrogenase n=1 Tax=Cellulophaga geojensis KL-A TaxID=1328323 RepID=A0ABN0RPZ4_9FLAO|nr:hypothetical protein [Cellulophaga geojensis]EWH13927.1 hypothetical protein KLA_07742 [Cellulophaga geojensis KL-A]
MTIEQFYFDIPIYTKVQITDENHDTFIAITDSSKEIVFDGYNPWRKIDSTFYVMNDIQGSSYHYSKYGGYGTMKVKCKRSDDVFMFFIHYDAHTKTLIKIGQHPTVADFHISEIKQYKKLLTTEKLNEFTRAIGLAANGVGIGSFVYLRRIFEFLIFEAYKKAKSEGKINEGDFQKGRMDDRIALLAGYLPTFLVENRSIYSVLSKGIHSLDEQTCLEHFDTLRVGIEIILDEKLEEQKKVEKMELAKKKIVALKGKLK